MPTTEPTPPIRELPDEIEKAIDRLSQCAKNLGLATEAPGRKQMYREAHADLRHAIRAALAEARREEMDSQRGTLQAIYDEDGQWRALLERCERLRRVADVASLCGTTPDIVLEVLADLHEDDYADDLRPRGGDER